MRGMPTLTGETGMTGSLGLSPRRGLSARVHERDGLRPANEREPTGRGMTRRLALSPRQGSLCQRFGQVVAYVP
jgi:hypothetical protein